MGIEFIPFQDEIIEISSEFRKNYGFLVNDSITTAQMKKLGILNIGTSDKDFEKIKIIKVYSPSDV